MLFPLNIKFFNEVSKFKILFDYILVNWFRKESSHEKNYIIKNV